MVLFNYATRELTAKVVYYGPGLCGKTTNLLYVHQNLPETVKGKMLSLATKTDRTLFFDFLPIDLGEIRGMKTRVQLYTVPGQVFYNETRKLVLKGADGIVFVADSQQQMTGANVESFRNLEENLKAHGMSLQEMPHVIQFNKRDLPNLSSIEEMNSAINRYNAPFYESVATTGIGVQDTLKAITKLVLLHLTQKYDPQAAKASDLGTAVPAPTPVAAEPAVPVAPATPVAPVGPVAPVATTPPATSEATIAMHASEIPTLSPTTPTPPQPSAGAAPAQASVTPAAPDPVPEFAEGEIDRLVDEVDEAAFAPAAAGDGAASQEPAAKDSGGAAPSPLEVDLEFDPEWREEPAAATSPEPVPEPAPEPVFAPTVPPLAASAAEDDGTARDGSSPEPAEPTELGGETPAPTGGETLVVSGGTPVATPIPVHHVEPQTPPPMFDESPADAPVLLTEEAADSDLFSDPNLEVARLTEGDVREIEVPVMVGEGPDARRLKLSVRLQLHPVD